MYFWICKLFEDSFAFEQFRVWINEINAMILAVYQSNTDIYMKSYYLFKQAFSGITRNY